MIETSFDNQSEKHSEDTTDPIRVFYEATPNPQAMKFIVNRELASEGVHFNTVEDARHAPLAKRILEFPWAAGVYIGMNFITVTKQDWVSWEVLADPLSSLIEEHFAQGLAALLPAELRARVAAVTSDGASTTVGNNEPQPEDSPVVVQIKNLLNSDIRPAVAMDGGDVLFHKYEANRVYLSLHGSCSGCPSSTMTLKEGIETRLRAAIPEILEVISIESD